MHPPSNQDNHIHSVLIDEMRKSCIMAAYSNFKDNMQTSPLFSCMLVS